MPEPIEPEFAVICERYMHGALVPLMDDFERLQLHEILRGLVNQLYEVSRRNIGLSVSERSGALLSPHEVAQRQSNRVLMGHIEHLIMKTSNDIALDVA